MGTGTLEGTPAGSPLLQDHWEMHSVGLAPTKDERESVEGRPFHRKENRKDKREEQAGPPALTGLFRGC